MVLWVVRWAGEVRQIRKVREVRQAREVREVLDDFFQDVLHDDLYHFLRGFPHVVPHRFFCVLYCYIDS